MGLGGLTSVPLVRACELAADCRAAVASGLNPIAERKATGDEAVIRGLRG
jgi:hypothetical protein